MHYDFLKFTHHVLCFITALCGIHVGLKALGYDFIGRVHFLSSNALYIDYIFGIAGAVSLVLLILHSVFCACGSHCSCGCKKSEHHGR